MAALHPATVFLAVFQSFPDVKRQATNAREITLRELFPLAALSIPPLFSVVLSHYLVFQVAARHPSTAHLLHVRVVHSKLACGRWPRLETDAHLPRRVRATLASWGFESSRREVSSADADPDGKGNRRTAIEAVSWAWLLKSSSVGFQKNTTSKHVCGRQPVSVSCSSPRVKWSLSPSLFPTSCTRSRSHRVSVHSVLKKDPLSGIPSVPLPKFSRGREEIAAKR